MVWDFPIDFHCCLKNPIVFHYILRISPSIPVCRLYGMVLPLHLEAEWLATHLRGQGIGQHCLQRYTRRGSLEELISQISS